MIKDGKIVGKVIFKSKEEQIKPDLVKTVLVLEEQKDKYPGSIVIDFINQGAKQVQGIEKGDMVEVEVNFKANLHNGRRYGSNRGWRIEKISDSQPETDLPF